MPLTCPASARARRGVPPAVASLRTPEKETAASPRLMNDRTGRPRREPRDPAPRPRVARRVELGAQETLPGPDSAALPSLPGGP
eukprot:15042438-Alexandrium_andersonii.AAC.1